jgi:hypothetical protein
MVVATIASGQPAPVPNTPAAGFEAGGALSLLVQNGNDHIVTLPRTIAVRLSIRASKNLH